MKQKIRLKPLPVTFKKWNNKKYAAFNSLKKVIKIGTLSVAYLLFANPETVFAQATDTSAVSKNYDLESIDVTSEQLPETYSSISRVVVTISKAEIERAAVSSVNELLEYASNIDIRQRGTDGIQADISIRGGSFDQVLVLLNGINITDPQTGHHSLNLPLDLSSIERVEILKGPGAWKFGPGAFSGAINIITNTAVNSYLKAEAEVGQFVSNSQKISAAIKVKNSTHLLALNRASSDGYVDNTDYWIKNAFYHGKLTMQNSEIAVQAGATSKAFGANSFYTAYFPDQYEEIQTYFLSAGYKIQIKKLQIDPKIYYRRNNDRFVLFREYPAWYSNFHTTDVYGANILANLLHGASATTSFGFDSRIETIYSNNLGEETDHTIQSPVNDTITLNRYHSRTNISAFIGHKHYFNKLMVNIGINLTHNTDIENEWFFFPGVDLNYEINDQSSVFASANKTMRMPTYTDLYYHGATNEGNPNLLPEEAIGYELGYKYHQNLIEYSVTGFITDGTNMIDWVREFDSEVWKTINYTNLNTFGVELALKTNLRKVFPSQSVFNDIKLYYTFLTQNKVETDMVSNYSLNYLKHRFDASINHLIWKDIKASWHFAFQDRNGQYEKIIDQEVVQDDGDGNFTSKIVQASAGMFNYDPFFTADLKIAWNHAGWNIYCVVNNLFNVRYYDYGNVPQPGRWFKFGIAKKIEFH